MLQRGANKNVFDEKPKELNLTDYKDFCDQKIFDSKRLNCAVRDYFKRKEYFEHISLLLGSKDTFQLLQDQLWQIELPGDSWNNNDKLSKCLKL